MVRLRGRVRWTLLAGAIVLASGGPHPQPLLEHWNSAAWSVIEIAWPVDRAAGLTGTETWTDAKEAESRFPLHTAPLIERHGC